MNDTLQTAIAKLLDEVAALAKVAREALELVVAEQKKLQKPK